MQNIISLFLTRKNMKLLGRNEKKKKISEDKNGENVSHLEITEVVLDHCNIVNNNCQHHSSCYFCSRQMICSINRYFTGRFYILKVFSFCISGY